MRFELTRVTPMDFKSIALTTRPSCRERWTMQRKNKPNKINLTLTTTTNQTTTRTTRPSPPSTSNNTQPTYLCHIQHQQQQLHTSRTSRYDRHAVLTLIQYTSTTQDSGAGTATEANQQKNKQYPTRTHPVTPSTHT